MITDILFDLGNVLVPVDREVAYRRLEPHLATDAARLLNEDRPAFERRLAGPISELESGRMDFPEFRRTLERRLGISLGEGEFHRIYCDIFRMNEEMVGLGERLTTRYGTWLASNTSEAHYQWILERFPRVAFYRDAALSYRLGVMKPAAKYFQMAIERFGVDPKRSVFIDDIDENVAAAVNCGLHGVLFKDYSQLVNDLQSLGVDVPGFRRCKE
jgi:putative hydrolase of the HAD superfamily